MRKTVWIGFLALLVLASTALAASFKIITSEAVIRKENRFFAPAVGRIPYGEMIQETGRKGDWLKASYGGKEGWLHISAVQEQKFRLSSLAGRKAEESTREEVALAGKGFTPEVEKSYRDQNPSLRFDLVEQIQRYRIDEQSLQAFIQRGSLKEPGGAQ